MKTSFKICVILSMLLASFACTKKEEITIPGNTAPPDSTIENVVKENYVNKTYISLLARKPDSLELVQGLTILNKNELSQDNREEFLDIVLSKDGYYQQAFDQGRADIVEGQDTSAFRQLWYQYNFGYQQAINEGQPQEILDLYIREIRKLDTILILVDILNAGQEDIKGMHRRLVDNGVYDDINMGTENFVVSMFQNFLFRYPTANPSDSTSTSNELENGKLIVEQGFQGVLFLKVGKTKEDFLDIWFSSIQYHEGQVRNLYNKYLFREPNSEEMSSLALSYLNSGNYKALQKHILTLDEYVGL